MQYFWVEVPTQTYRKYLIEAEDEDEARELVIDGAGVMNMNGDSDIHESNRYLDPDDIGVVAVDQDCLSKICNHPGCKDSF